MLVWAAVDKREQGAIPGAKHRHRHVAKMHAARTAGWDVRFDSDINPL